ncbi:neutral alpha-glucosidase C isoform X1 [Cottoperca gobio]|uniref:Neutral alpha-glucosidase C-like isoform X1 n=1 Tax=Cottoperca gobio TaxID=56716 RepID=A0A6J2S3T4_COTGO|nr:neutral alpha-glucosidase C-like isoform X1 [Cottoperca gobio]XP_029316280.1 neutral alpha-glucosidase C-like isoform X1 [Cottoperca gobio]
MAEVSQHVIRVVPEDEGKEKFKKSGHVAFYRYCLLPYWYALFHLPHTCGLPPIRPLWGEFPREPSTFTVDNLYMIGDKKTNLFCYHFLSYCTLVCLSFTVFNCNVGGALLACPVTEARAQEVKVLLPGSDEVWFDVRSAEEYEGGRTLSLPVALHLVPVFQRGGSVVCRSTGSGSCTAEQQQLPLSITVALDSQGVADGELYLDDGYRDKKAFCCAGRIHHT